MKDLNFFINCDGKYNLFILPYIFFALTQEPNSVIEVVTDRPDDIKKMKGLDILKEIFDTEFLIRNKKNCNIPSQKSRFLEEPELKTNYTYIGDVDILLTESIKEFHIMKMERRKLCFDNEIRPNISNKRITGLHFVKSNEYYKKTNKSRSKYITCSGGNDENMLYNIIEDTFGDPIKIMSDEPICTENFVKNRPVHGIHMSLNRAPIVIQPEKRFKWVVKSHEEKEYVRIVNTEEWKAFEHYLPQKFKNLQKLLEEFCKIENGVYSI